MPLFELEPFNSTQRPADILAAGLFDHGYRAARDGTAELKLRKGEQVTRVGQLDFYPELITDLAAAGLKPFALNMDAMLTRFELRFASKTIAKRTSRQFCEIIAPILSAHEMKIAYFFGQTEKSLSSDRAAFLIVENDKPSERHLDAFTRWRLFIHYRGTEPTDLEVEAQINTGRYAYLEDLKALAAEQAATIDAVKTAASRSRP